MSNNRKLKEINSIARQVYAASKVGRIDSFPEKISLAPSYRCNFNCVTCSQNHNDTSDYPPVFIDRLKQILPFVKNVNINGGEPLMYPHLQELIGQITKFESRIWIVTNGSLLTERWQDYFIDSSLEVMKFSIDGGDKAAYNSIRRNGNFHNVLKNIGNLSLKRLKNNRHDISFQINFIALRRNIDSLPKLVRLAHNLGVSQINVNYCQCHSEELAMDSLYFHQEHSDEKMLIAHQMGKELGVNVSLPKLFSKQGPKSWLNSSTCSYPYHYLLISNRGSCAMCCGTSSRVGNFFEQDFDEIWNHDLWVDVRRRLNTDDQHPMCNNCVLSKRDPKGIAAHIADPAIARKAVALMKHENTSILES